MQELVERDSPRVPSVSVTAYELNSVALAVAAEAETLARRGQAGETGEIDASVVEEMEALISRLQRGTRALRFARLSGQGLPRR